jgi:hypothetical protein
LAGLFGTIVAAAKRAATVPPLIPTAAENAVLLALRATLEVDHAGPVKTSAADRYS